MTYTVKRGYSKREGCRMYGIYRDGKLYEKYVLFNRPNAALIAEWLTMMEQFIIPQDAGMFQIMQIMNIDRRQHNGEHTG